MQVKIKEIKPTVITDKTIWTQIIAEVMHKPSQEVIERNKKALELLAEIRK